MIFLDCIDITKKTLHAENHSDNLFDLLIFLLAPHHEDLEEKESIMIRNEEQLMAQKQEKEYSERKMQEEKTVDKEKLASGRLNDEFSC